jgi:hypothetical protein
LCIIRYKGLAMHACRCVWITGLSLFNTFFVLEALAAVGDIDRGYATLHLCWGYIITLGGTTVWEAGRPDWGLLFGACVTTASLPTCPPARLPPFCCSR